MDVVGFWGILFGLATFVGGGSFALAIQMRTERRYQAAWVSLMLSPVPLAIWLVVWANMASPPDTLRRSLSAVIGAIAGAVILVGATEMFHGRANAQGAVMPGNSPRSPQPIPPQQFTNQGGNQYNAPGGNIYAGPPPATPQRNPNWLYQYGQKVGVVIGANVILHLGKVQFQQLYGAGDLNTAADFEYQNYKLHFVSADGNASLSSATTLTGVALNGTLQNNIASNIVCRIVSVSDDNPAERPPSTDSTPQGNNEGKPSHPSGRPSHALVMQGDVSGVTIGELHTKGFANPVGLYSSENPDVPGPRDINIVKAKLIR